jgi:hypothetical protein
MSFSLQTSFRGFVFGFLHRFGLIFLGYIHQFSVVVQFRVPLSPPVSVIKAVLVSLEIELTPTFFSVFRVFMVLRYSPNP